MDGWTIFWAGIFGGIVGCLLQFFIPNSFLNEGNEE